MNERHDLAPPAAASPHDEIRTARRKKRRPPLVRILAIAAVSAGTAACPFVSSNPPWPEEVDAGVDAGSDAGVGDDDAGVNADDDAGQ